MRVIKVTANGREQYLSVKKPNLITRWMLKLWEARYNKEITRTVRMDISDDTNNSSYYTK